MKNKRSEVDLKSVTALAIFVLAIMSIPAVAQPLSVTVSIGDVTLAPQTAATLPIMITDVPPNNVSSALINLTYDSTVVEIVAVGNSDFDEFEANTNNISNKVLMYGHQNVSPNLAGPITFAEVTVKAIGLPGECSPLNIEVRSITMGSASEYHNYIINNGSVCIITGVPVYSNAGMIALIGLLAFVLAVAVRKRPE
jgi:hypothetical protein